MSVANMITAARAEGFKHVVLNVGALFKDFDVTQYTTTSALKTALASALSDESKCLGMTRGGGSFTTTRKMRQIEADGLRYRYVGDTTTDSIDATLNFTFIEMSAKNIEMGLTATNENVSGQVTKITPRTRIEAGDYIQNLVLATDLGDGGVLVIHFKNALNTADFTVTYTDKGEATYPLEFHPYQDDLEDYDTAPYDIYVYEGDKITLNKSNLAITGTGTGSITATTVPAGATVTWASTNTGVATVSSGTVTGVAPGSCWITATLDSGVSAKCKVVVSAAAQGG